MRQSAWCALLSCGLSCEVPAPSFEWIVGNTEAIDVRSAARAPGFCVPRRGKGLPPLAPHPHPRVWPPTSASLRMQPISVDEAEHFTSQSSCQRRYDGVRDHPGMPFGFPPELAFSFVGIPRGRKIFSRHTANAALGERPNGTHLGVYSEAG